MLFPRFPLPFVCLFSPRHYWFLTGLYHERDPLIPLRRANVVYVCALAMTLLYQPDPSDNRLLHQFRRYIDAYFQSMGIIDELDCNQCQLLVMAYFKRIYHHDILFHTRYSVLYSYAEWFKFIAICERDSISR